MDKELNGKRVELQLTSFWQPAVRSVAISDCSCNRRPAGWYRSDPGIREFKLILGDMASGNYEMTALGPPGPAG